MLAHTATANGLMCMAWRDGCICYTICARVYTAYYMFTHVMTTDYWRVSIEDRDREVGDTGTELNGPMKAGQLHLGRVM
jgi:hypothetical protein